MHREGHLGAALLCYTPLGFVIVLVVTVEFAVLGALAAAGFSMVPDLDMRVPGLKHRGVTHTVHFALAFGCGIGLLSAAVAWSAGAVPSLVVGVFGCLVGALTIVSHIAADALTPTGVDPFSRGETISYDVAQARNPPRQLWPVGPRLWGLPLRSLDCRIAWSMSSTNPTTPEKI